MSFFGKIKSAVNWLISSLRNRYEAAVRWSKDRTVIDTNITDERFDCTSSERIVIVGKSRFFEKNDAVAQRCGQIFEQFVAGPFGLPVTPTSEDEDYNIKAEAKFATWCKYPDLCSRMSFNSFVGMTAWRWFFDGEAIWLLTREKNWRNFPRVQFIPTHRMRSPDFAEPGSRIVDGVEVNEFGRPIRYWIDDSFDGSGPKPREAANVIHIFEPSFAGQYRGIPKLHGAINDLHDLSDLQLFEMRGAKDNSAVSKIIKKQSGDISDEQTVRASAVTGNSADDDKYYAKRFGGETKILKPGDTYEEHRSERPSVAMQWFWRHLVSRVCAASGVPVQLAFPESIQGTVERAELDIAAGYFKSQCSVLSDAIKRVYEFVMDWENGNDASLRPVPKDWYECEITPPRAPNVDVGRNSAAAIAELTANITTLSDLYGQLGKNWRAQLRQRAKEKAYEQKLMPAPQEPQQKKEDKPNE